MKFFRTKFNACLGAFASLCFLSGTADAVLASVKATGMAGTAVAYPQDTLSGAFNPAGLADVGNRWDLGIFAVRYNGQSKVTGNTIPGVNGTFNGFRTFGGEWQFSPDVGVNKEFCLCDDWNMTFGVIGYNRNYIKTRYHDSFVLLGTSKLKLEYVNEQISPIWTVKFCDKYAFGVSLDFLVQRLKVSGVQNFDNVIFSAHPNHVTNRRYAYSYGVGVTIGGRVQISPVLSVGLAYHPETHMSRFKKYRGFLADRGKFNIPHRILGGIAWRFMHCATLAFDVEHVGWNKIKALNNNLLHSGTLELLGSQNGPGFGWKSQTFYRVGVDYDICESLTVRGGYRYARTPVRSSQTVVNQLSLETVQSVLTLGATWCLNACSEVSFMYAHGFNHKVRGHHSIPESVNGIPFGGGEADLRQHLDVVGLSWGQTF